MSNLPQISEAEFEVMKIVWKYAPISTNEITEKLSSLNNKNKDEYENFDINNNNDKNDDFDINDINIDIFDNDQFSRT